jgi:cobalt-zinc-cadmium efflux system outer membrane protein
LRVPVIPSWQIAPVFSYPYCVAPVKAFKILLFLISLSGCASYHPLSLSHASVRQLLRRPSAKALQVAAAQLHHPLLAPVRLNFRNGIGPDQAAILAVILNPKLRADRDRKGLAAAQLIQAGILPNPTVGYSRDLVTGGNTAGTVSAFGFTGSWDISALVSHSAKVAAARANVQAISLDVAWTEWQTAVAAKLALYRVVALEEELIRARQISSDQQQTVDTLQAAVDRHEKSMLDLAAAQASREDARATELALEQELGRQRLELKKAVGVLPETDLSIERGIALPSHLPLPSEGELNADLENRRLDLVGLRQGYQSQEQTVRAAVLAQFPKVVLGFSRGSDTTNVHTAGFGVTIDLPVFDRNQGNIAIETATRRKLFDEYTARVFEAHADMATAVADIRSLNRQIAAAEAALPVLQHLVDIAKEASDQGAADILGYFQARTNLNQKSLQILKLKQQLVDSRIALELASGRYFPGGDWHRKSE